MQPVRFLTAVVVILSLAGSSRAGIVISNFAQGNSGGTLTFADNVYHASDFTTNNSDLLVTRVSLLLFAANPASTTHTRTANVWLFNNGSGAPTGSGTLLGSITFTAATLVGNSVQYDLDISRLLNPNTTYWLAVTNASGSGNALGIRPKSGQTMDSGNLWTSPATGRFVSTDSFAASWSAPMSGGINNLPFQITAVPEPNTLVLGTWALLGWCLIRRKRTKVDFEAQ
jgi:hypothetical protein